MSRYEYWVGSPNILAHNIAEDYFNGNKRKLTRLKKFHECVKESSSFIKMNNWDRCNQ